MNRKGAGAQYEYESDDDDDDEEPEWRGGRCRIHHAGRERSNEPNGWEKRRASRMDGKKDERAGGWTDGTAFTRSRRMEDRIHDDAGMMPEVQACTTYRAERARSPPPSRVPVSCWLVR